MQQNVINSGKERKWRRKKDQNKNALNVKKNDNDLKKKLELEKKKKHCSENKK